MGTTRFRCCFRTGRELWRCRRRYLNFAVSAQGIYYASTSDPIHWFELWLYRFSTGKSERIRRIETMFWQGLSVAPDDRWLLFVAAQDDHGDLQMVENFR